MAHLRVQGVALTAISAALPPESMWGRSAKVGQADAIAQAVEGASSPVVIGMDRNDPKFERWDTADTEWWPEDPDNVFDDDAPHGCVDVLDRWYASKPDALRQAKRAHRAGPREVSYIEDRADPAIERRYDIIMTDRTVEVGGVRYRYHDAVEAGSDHGLVEATLSL